MTLNQVEFRCTHYRLEIKLPAAPSHSVLPISYTVSDTVIFAADHKAHIRLTAHCARSLLYPFSIQ